MNLIKIYFKKIDAYFEIDLFINTQTYSRRFSKNK